jgi:DNA-binding response OmpR family regulator
MTAPKHILVIEDDWELRKSIATQLEMEGGFTAVEISSSVDIAAQLASRSMRFDAIVLGDTRWGSDAHSLCVRLRRAGLQLPIIMISSTNDEDDVIRCLDSGANDCMIKPLHFGELRARLRAHIRDHAMSDNAVLGIGPYHFSPGTRSLYHPAEDRQIHLTVKEAALLRLLHQAGGEPIGRQTLLRRVWGRSASVFSHTAETHISRLRRKIEPSLSIEHIPMLGEAGAYRLRTREADEAPARRPMRGDPSINASAG